MVINHMVPLVITEICLFVLTRGCKRLIGRIVSKGVLGMSIAVPVFGDDLVFPAFLTRCADEARAPYGVVEPCDQIAESAGVAWAALKLFWLAMYALARAIACRLVLSGLVRVQGMRCRSPMHRLAARSSGYLVGFVAGGLMFF
jgi:hypothetical protein